MKKMSKIALSIAVASFFVACGGGGSSSSDDAKDTKVTKTFKLSKDKVDGKAFTTKNKIVAKFIGDNFVVHHGEKDYKGTWEITGDTEALLTSSELSEPMKLAFEDVNSNGKIDENDKMTAYLLGKSMEDVITKVGVADASANENSVSTDKDNNNVGQINTDFKLKVADLSAKRVSIGGMFKIDFTSDTEFNYNVGTPKSGTWKLEGNTVVLTFVKPAPATSKIEFKGVNSGDKVILSDFVMGNGENSIDGIAAL